MNSGSQKQVHRSQPTAVADRATRRKDSKHRSRPPQPEALLRAAREWRVTMDALHDAICLLDREGNILRCNRGMQQLLDLPFNAILGRSCWELVYGRREPPDGYRLNDQAERYFATKCIGGSWYTISMDPVRDENGHLTSVAHVMVDMSEAKRAEEEIKHYSEQLQTLHEIDLAILNLRSPRKIAQDALKRLRNRMQFMAASVIVFDEEFENAQGLFFADDGANMASDITIPADQKWVKDLQRGISNGLPDSRLLLPRTSDGTALSEKGIKSCLSMPLLARGRLIGSVNLGFAERSGLSAIQYEIVRQLATSLAVSLQNARLFESVQKQQKMLQEFAGRITNVDEALRKRLAQELHDRVGQNLTALGINLNHVQNLLAGESPLITERLNEALEEIEQISDSIRDVMAELRPAVLDDYGLVAALRCYIQQFSRRTGVAADVSALNPIPRLPQETETALFRIAQEALNNISKHADASQVTIAFKATESAVMMVIEDDGVGFDLRRQKRSGKSRGWGLATMKERAENVGGACIVESSPGEGTRVSVKVRRNK